MPNRLAESASPYLLQHAANPVDWQEWGDAAFDEAAARDVPVLLSIGYAACHWCHVMAHESFEDQATAEVMNERFVNVKVDREERPDVDRIYMDATQAMTGRGGWPMTVFLTPDRKPFFAGTYFPKEGRHGMPSFMTILGAISDAWVNRRQDVESQAKTLTDAVARKLPTGSSDADEGLIRSAYERIAGSFDPTHGGFGGAPKFPQAPTLEFLLRTADDPIAPQAKRMLAETLRAMAAGGIYDHIGGGFARYSVDRQWLVPHFEKMLYDNALLARLYLRAWQVVGDDGFRRVATETLDYLIRDMTLPGGGIASSEDADSEGEEGTFYTWGFDEFAAAAGDEAGEAARYFGVTPEGNFEGRTILSVVDPDVDADLVTSVKSRLFEARAVRIRPDRDDKAVAVWNALALRAFSEAALVLGEKRYLHAAQGIAGFLTTDMRRNDGRLLRSRRRGVGSIPAFCEDYGAAVLGLLSLNGADGDDAWLRVAVDLAEDMVRLFMGRDGFFATGSDAEELITRPLDLMDNPTPSGNSLAAEGLFTLSLLTGRDDLAEAAATARRAGGALMTEHPAAVGHLLAVSHTALGDVRELAIVGPRDHPTTGEFAAAAASAFRPDLAIVRSDAAEAPLPIFEGRLPAPGPLAYLCRNFACEAPTSDPVQLLGALDP